MTEAPKRHRAWAEFSLLATALIWGVNIPIVKGAVEVVDPFTFNALRMVLSTLTLGILCFLERKHLARPVQAVGFRWWIGYAALSGVLYPCLFMFGLSRTTAGNTALLLATLPVWTALISAIAVRERLSKISWIGLVVCLIGTSVVILAGGSVSLAWDYQIGNLFVLLSAICWAAATVVSAPMLAKTSPLTLAFVMSCIATPIQLSITAFNVPNALITLWQPDLMFALVYSGVMSTGVAYATWHVGVRRLGGSHAAVFQNLVVLVAVVTAWLLLSEPILSSQIAGGLVLFFGLYLIRKGREHAPHDKEAPEENGTTDPASESLGRVEASKESERAEVVEDEVVSTRDN